MYLNLNPIPPTRWAQAHRVGGIGIDMDRQHGGNIWQYPKTPKKKIIDFSASINPLGLSPKVKETILNNLDSLVHYPDSEYRDLKNVLSRFHNVHQTNILPGNGSIELIHLIPRALSAKKTLIICPTFSEYEFAVRLNKAAVFFILCTEQEDFRIDIQRIKKFIPQANLIFLCNPNNPTGTLLQKNEIMELAGLCRKYNTTLVIDEVFIDFLQNSQQLTLINEAVKYKQILVIRSLTKFFSLPGLRIGYLIGQQKIIKHISKFQYPWNVNLLAQIAAREALKDRHYMKSCKRVIWEEIDFLSENLCRINGLKVYPPSANFVFCKLDKCRIRNAQQLSNELLKYGIVIRCCGNFRGLNNRFFRVAVRTRIENKKLINNLKAILYG